ncbi:MAG: extracellular solute-binding protein [Opitutaceae bacterium]|nr:extracellular solute-binding protein [Opitutaceae bacterium]MBP9912875.1 extracellular solute-binding protein [Opitutaceae bacterium]
MKRRWTRSRLALVVLVAAYVASAWWLFVRKTGAEGDGRPTIRIAHWQVERGPPDGLDAVIKRYEELNPAVNVEQVQVPGPVYLQWLRTNLVGGTGTDIIEYGTFLAGMQDVPARFFAPITAELEEPNPYNRGTPLEGVPWRNTFVDGLYNEQIFAPEIGQIYSVTLTQVTLRVFCNENLLREIVGDDPDFRFPENFDALRKLFVRTQEFARRTGRGVHAIAGARLNAEWTLDMIMNYVLLRKSVELDHEGLLARFPRNVQMDYLLGRWNYHQPDVMAALKMVRELTEQMRPGFIQLERDAAVQEFMRGDALFVLTGTWDATSLRQLASFPVGIHRFPQPDANDPVSGRYYYGRTADGSGLTAMAMYLNKSTPHRAETIDFMRFMTSVEGGQLFMDHSGWISSVRDTRVPADLVPALGIVDGYSAGGGYMRTGASTAQAFIKNMYKLVGPQGSVEGFVEAVDQDMPVAQRADLETELRNLTNALRPQDAEFMAMRALDRIGPVSAAITARGDSLETSQTLSEINIYQGLTVLAQTAAKP